MLHLAALLALALTTAASAQSDTLPSPDNLNVQSVERLAETVAAQLKAENCTEALNTLPIYAAATAGLASMMVVPLLPHFEMEDPNRPSGLSKDLIENIQRRAAYWRRERNKSWVAEAECLAKVGQRAEAAQKYVEALKQIDASETETWARAREGLWTLIGVDH